MTRQLLSFVAIAALCLSALGCHISNPGVTKCGSPLPCGPVQKTGCVDGSCGRQTLECTRCIQPAGFCATGVCQKGPVQKVGPVQKCEPVQKGPVQKCGPVQKSSCCQKGVCQKGVCQKGACQKGPCQKSVCQKGACQKGPCQKTVCQKATPSKGGKGHRCRLLSHLTPHFWSGCGCGEKYVGPWISDPPACCDPCDDCGNWVGARACSKKIIDPWLWLLAGHGRHCKGDCCGGACGNKGKIGGSFDAMPGMIIEPTPHGGGEIIMPPTPGTQATPTPAQYYQTSVPTSHGLQVRQASALSATFGEALGVNSTDSVQRAVHHVPQVRR